jgi:hypothetical protein
MNKSVLQDGFTTVHSNLLFGENCTAETAFDALDKDGNGVVSYIVGVGIFGNLLSSP